MCPCTTVLGSGSAVWAGLFPCRRDGINTEMSLRSQFMGLVSLRESTNIMTMACTVVRGTVHGGEIRDKISPEMMELAHQQIFQFWRCMCATKKRVRSTAKEDHLEGKVQDKLGAKMCQSEGSVQDKLAAKKC